MCAYGCEEQMCMKRYCIWSNTCIWRTDVNDIYIYIYNYIYLHNRGCPPRAERRALHHRPSHGCCQTRRPQVPAHRQAGSPTARLRRIRRLPLAGLLLLPHRAGRGSTAGLRELRHADGWCAKTARSNPPSRASPPPASIFSFIFISVLFI